MTVEVEHSSTSLSVETQGDTARFVLHIQAQGGWRMKPCPPNSARAPEVDRELSARIEEEVLRAIRETIQEQDCDAVGFHRRLMQSAPSLLQGREEEWRDRLRTCEYTVHVDAHGPLRRGSGTIRIKEARQVGLFLVLGFYR